MARLHSGEVQAARDLLRRLVGHPSHFLTILSTSGDTDYDSRRPFGPLWLFMADPELAAEFVTVKQSLPKSHLETDYIIQLQIGRAHV